MMPGFTAQEFSLPPMADKMRNKSEWSGYTIKYIKADMDDVTDMAELSVILTKGIDGSGDIVILNQSSFTFMTQMFLIVQYAERRPE